MQFSTINVSDAPVAAPKVSKVAEQLVAALANLTAGNVLAITPDEGKSIRGTKTGIGRIAAMAGFEVTTWDDGTRVYVRVDGGVAAVEVEEEDDFDA